jgi:precorrin-2 dehydrogenase/sirohydrochlorin ferrochelatase
MFPLFLNLAGRLAVVVGGGPVGRRKAQALLDGGAAVRLVCLEPRPAEEISPALEWITAPYQTNHLDGASLVLAAAPPVNAQVAADARARGLWVNSASDPRSADFFLPSLVHRGNLVIAIGTGGKAPALARAVRLLIEEQLDEAFAYWVGLLAEMRPLVRQLIAEPGQRHELLRRLCAPNWLERLRREGIEAVREAMRRELMISISDPPGRRET